MRSPFPGMDPYIEACGLWEDFHEALIAQIRDALAQSVPDHYVVRFNERSYVALVTSEDLGLPDRRTSQADVAIAFAPGRSRSVSEGATAVAELPATGADDSPVAMRALVEMEFRESFVEVYELRPKRRLVTTVEVLSPSNKRYKTPGWFRYSRKRQAHLEGLANLVEIDLLRGGRRMPMEDEWPDSDVDIAMLLPPDKAKTLGALDLVKTQAELASLLHKPVDLLNLRQISTVFQKEVVMADRRIFTVNEYAAEEFEMLTLSFYQKLNEERAEILSEGLRSGRFYNV